LIPFALDLGNLRSSTVHGLQTISVHPATKPTGHGMRPGLGELLVKPAAQTNAIEQPFATKLRAFNRRAEESGFRNRL
jgi:hypothetical protein